MKNLKTLIIKCGCFSKGPKHLPNSLRVLEWPGYPSPSLPSDFYPKKLFKLELPHSYLTSLELLVSKKNFMNMTYLNFDDCQGIIEIPDLSGAPYLETLSFSSCLNLNNIHESVGFLDKLRRLDAFGCEKLRIFPPIKLTSLEHLDLSFCKSLERFPEILGNMERITELPIKYSGIKELPFSMHYLTGLQILVVEGNGRLYLPSSVARLAELESNLSHELLSGFLTWPANLTMLTLSGFNLTIIPASIKECRSLRDLKLMDFKHLREIEGIPPNLRTFQLMRCISLMVLDLSLLPTGTDECCFLTVLDVTGCENLQEIIGIPSNLKRLYAQNCKSLSSTCRSMLLNQELHERTPFEFFEFPGTRIPKWFEHCSAGPSISFWFRDKFPTISLCFLIGIQDMYCFKITVNGIKDVTWRLHGWGRERFRYWLETGHTYITTVQIKNDAALLENGWNHFTFSLELFTNPLKVPIDQIGLHVVKQASFIEDIRFTNPYKRSKLNDDIIISESSTGGTRPDNMQLEEPIEKIDSIDLVNIDDGNSNLQTMD